MSAWSVPQTFLALIREGGVTAGARSLGIDPATARGRLAEAPEVAKTLPHPPADPSAAAMTELLIALAARMEALTELRPASISPLASVEGVVTVSLGEMLALEVFGPCFASLIETFPRLNLDIQISAARANLLRGEADVAVRLTEPDQKAMRARRTGRLTIGFWARRDYLARVGRPENLADLARVSVIGPADETGFLRLARRYGFQMPRGAFALRSDTSAGQLASVRAGMGLGLLFDAVGSADPTLERVLDDFAPAFDTYVVMHEDQRESRAVRCVFDSLVRFLVHLGGDAEPGTRRGH